MLITAENVLSEMQQAVPNFLMNPEWRLEGLTSPVFNDFARFICSEAEVLQYARSETEAGRLSQVETSMAFLERALRDGDGDVHALVLECVETLASCEWVNRARKYFGPTIRDLWVHRFSGPGDLL